MERPPAGEREWAETLHVPFSSVGRLFTHSNSKARHLGIQLNNFQEKLQANSRITCSRH